MTAEKELVKIEISNTWDRQFILLSANVFSSANDDEENFQFYNIEVSPHEDNNNPVNGIHKCYTINDKMKILVTLLLQVIELKTIKWEDIEIKKVYNKTITNISIKNSEKVDWHILWEKPANAYSVYSIRKTWDIHPLNPSLLNNILDKEFWTAYSSWFLIHNSSFFFNL